MAMGLIAAALGGAGKALSSIGEIEAKKQNEAKLRKNPRMAMPYKNWARMTEVDKVKLRAHAQQFLETLG